jgi:hypothetical protein
VESGDNQTRAQLTTHLLIVEADDIAPHCSLGILVGGGAMRVFRTFMAACLLVTQVSCTADILPWPGFESKPAIFSYAEQIPASEVSEQVRCAWD